jgi:magnesium transporter
MRMVVNCAAYQDGRRVADIDIEHDAGSGLDLGLRGDGAPGERFVWLGLHEPSEDLLRKVQGRFGLHDLAIEDAHRAHQRPKLEVYGDSLFVVLRTAQLQGSKIQFGETHIFAGRGYVVTVRHGPSLSYADVRARCEQAPALLRLGESFVLYSLMDFVVDNYFPTIDALEAEVDALELEVFEQASGREDIGRIYELRRELLMLRRTVAPLLDVCDRLVRFDVPLVETDMRPYFRDVRDHVIRVHERIDDLRELLTSTMETNLLLASVRQNDVMKKLAGWAAILAVPTAVFGLYGMNFEAMPEVRSPYGYPAVLAVVAALCAYLYYRFRRAGWF